MTPWPQTLQDWAAVVQAVAAVGGLALASIAVRGWQTQGQAQRQQQLSQVTIHNYPEAAKFGEDQVEAKQR